MPLENGNNEDKASNLTDIPISTNFVCYFMRNLSPGMGCCDDNRKARPGQLGAL